ncbi:DUF1194 domain-containing protein [Corallincola spongiicola]|uniref:DUF1194 domain-containing protein n=1 Tax=Corallincola spongiicola TaxID=2520508 RepID=A0ABY1WP67_9GAMM|nr:DUF1194 domain-containing protein [Corallincola spongiicola]TAA45873.1 DUF1194 domain-containing protein [Corallincola spongiicola]
MQNRRKVAFFMKSVSFTLSSWIALSAQSHAIEIVELDVDVELQLLMDISGSVNHQEYLLQRDGYAQAFSNDQVQQSILQGELGKVAVQLVMWSGQNQQSVMADWTLIDSVTSALDFSASLAELARPFWHMTGVGDAIDFGVAQFEDNGFNGTRQIIDVSGDGIENSGRDTLQARGDALTKVDTINGIVISPYQSVNDFYMDEVVGGENAFLMQVDRFEQFGDAIQQKLSYEISGDGIPPEATRVIVPVTGSLSLSALGLLFLAISLKRRKEH